MRGFSPFDVVFLAGLLAGVRVMMSGVEKNRGASGSVVRTRWAMMAGALTLSGFAASLLLRLSVPQVTTGALSLAAFLVGAAGARLIVRTAVRMPVSEHEFDPRFELQGVPGMVVEAIPAAGEGVVRVLSRSGPPSLVAARSIDGMAIARDVEVGVERIDEGVAFVEAWSAIESRL